MGNEEDRLMRENSLSFFGTIAAGLSHELSNSMAIINELNGLMNDLLPKAKRKAKVDSIRLKELSQRISDQIKRGQDIIKMLNRFAHSTDDAIRSIDLSALVKELVSLTQRFAFLKKVSLEAELPDEALTITSDPFRLQQALFICIQLALDSSQKGDVVNVAYEKVESGAKITVVSAHRTQAEDFDSRTSFLSILAESLGGKTEIAAVDPDKRRFELYLPESLDN